MSVEEIVSIVAGVFAIGGSLYAVFSWFVTKSWRPRPLNAYEKEGNVYFTYSSGTTKTGYVCE
jgi:hypothetical protein